MTTWDQGIRSTRIVCLAMLASIPVYAVIGEVVGPKEPRDFAIFRLIFFVASATSGLIAFQFRQRMIPAAEEMLRRTPDDAAAAQRWIGAHIVSFALAESIALCGFALRFLGGSLLESLPFYAVSFALLLIWVPRRPN